jgi:hypothetical protein
MYAYTTAVTPSQQMAFRQSTNQYDVTERTFVFLGIGKWKNTRGMDTRYNLYYSAEYLQVGQLDARPNIEDNAPIATLNSTAYISHPTGGLYAYTGNKLPSSDYSTEILNLSKLLPPVIQSWRSVPGTKSVIDCDVGGNGERADVKMEFMFTYQIRDGLGRVFESGSSEKADGIFMAKPTADGTAYTENIEVVFRPPVFNPGDRWVGMRLVAYLRAIYGEENSEDLGYVQYETTMPVPLSYNQTDVPRLAMTLGRTSIDAIIGNPKFVEQQGAKPNISAPTAKLLVEHGGRLVAGDITAPSRTEISVGGFLADGTPPYLKTAEFCTVPFGLKELGGALRPYKNQTETSISDYNFRTAKVKWWDSSVSTSGITVEYNDLSNEFKAAFLPLLTQGSTSRPSVKYIFRSASQGDTNFSIPLTSATFSEVKDVVDNSNPNSGMSIPNTFTLRSTKKCTETLLANGTCPDIDKISMFPMANVTDITEEEVSNGTAFLTVNSGSLYYYVKLRKNSEGNYEPMAWAPYQTPTFDPYAGGELLLAFIGPKTLFNLSYDNTGIKNFDTDLLFYASAEDFSLEASKPRVQLNGEMYYRYRLIPVNVSLVSDPFIAVPPAQNIPDWAMYVDERDVKRKTEFEVGAELSTEKYSMSIFAAPMSYSGNIGEVTGKNGYILVAGTRYAAYPNTTQTGGTRPVVFSGFSNISEVISISKSPVGSLLTDVAINDFITLELDEADVKRLPTNCPVIGSTTYRVVSTGASSIQIAARADENQKSPIPNFSLATTGSTSCVVKLKKLFQKIGNDVKIPIDSSVADSWYTNAGKLFLLVRGDEDSTTSLRCSGHYSYSYSIDGGLVSYTLTTGENGQRTAFDYSQISGVRNSYVIAIEGTSAQLPVPVPLSVNSEYLQDLASPVFNPDVVPGSIYHAVSRRIAAIQGFISEGSGELGVSVETGKVYGIGTANRWENSTKGAIIYSNNGASYEYIPPVRYKNRIQWTNKILATQQNSNLMPMFKYESLQDIYTGDDSEITGLASVQNTLLVAKRGALFRAIFDADDVMTLQRIQSPVGAYGMYNIPTTLSYAYFLNPTGVYYTDGNSVENVFKLSKRFRDNVLKYPELMNKCSGYVDHTNKVMHLGVPYASRFYYAGAEAFGQFVYSYNDGVMGWSVNTGIPATCWVRHDGQHVFGTVDGRVCTTLSTVEGPRAYADDGRAIKYAMRTRFADGGDKVRFKFYRSAIFQFGTEGDVDFSTYYSTNYNNPEYPFQTYQIEGDNANGSMWRGDKFLKTLRETVAARVAQLAFTIVASVRYSSAPIYGIFLEGFKTNTRPIDQKNTPGNTRT